MLDIITHRNSVTNSKDAKSILIVYDEQRMFIGDTYRLINQLFSCKSFFTQAYFDLNCRNKKHTALCNALLANNPYIREFNTREWDELDFGLYDIVFCIVQDEARLLQSLQKNYNDRVPGRPWTTAVYSMTAQFLNARLNPIISSVFPPFREILDNPAVSITAAPSELYITRKEVEWANQWLRNNGIKEHEHLFIILDSTSERYKLITMDTYHTMLSHLLNEESVRLLIFDEQNIGKESFYREWIGAEQMSKFLFAKKLGLREALCLLSSDYTKLIFGPCTGMMHCASGIYNNFARNGRPAASLPKVITYTGRYSDGYTADFWWAGSPLVSCLVLRTTAGNQKEAVLLSDLPEEEKKDPSRLLFCEEYTPDLLIKFLPAHTGAMVI